MNSLFYLLIYLIDLLWSIVEKIISKRKITHQIRDVTPVANKLDTANV